jgi:hypothetical protein
MLPCSLLATDSVLIVADEFPAMEYVAGKLKSVENVNARVVWQTNLPPELSAFSAVMVYIHKDLKEGPEKAFIKYAEGGGKLIVLHHGVSSGKRKNKYWFKFLGLTLPEADVDAGGYKWIKDISQQVVNLSDHFITTSKVIYPEKVAFHPAGEEKEKLRPGFTLEKNSEVYINHTLAADPTRQILLGYRYTDKTSGKTYMQATYGWLKPTGKGWTLYLQPGHSLDDLKHPTFERILLNALVWKP